MLLSFPNRICASTLGLRWGGFVSGAGSVPVSPWLACSGSVASSPAGLFVCGSCCVDGVVVLSSELSSLQAVIKSDANTRLPKSVFF